MSIQKEDVKAVIQLYNKIYDKMQEIVDILHGTHEFFLHEGRYYAWPEWDPCECNWWVHWSWSKGYGDDEGRFKISETILHLPLDEAVEAAGNQITRQLEEERKAYEERQRKLNQQQVESKKRELEALGFKVEPRKALEEGKHV